MSLVLPPDIEASGIGGWGRWAARRKTVMPTGRKAQPLRCYFGGKVGMRRVVVRGVGSPEVVVRVSEVSPESSFRELDDFFLQTQTRIWLGEVLHMRLDKDTPIADLLADGELLFQVSKVVGKMLLNKRSDPMDSKLFIHERTSLSKSDGKYLAYPKVDSFLKICQILGLTGIDLFSPSDVVDTRGIRRVCMCIRSLSKKARSKKINVPDFDIVTYTIAMPTGIVGGILRILEQSSCSSSISDSYGDCSRSYKQNGYCGHYDQSHDYLSESDGAERCSNELDFETQSANDSFHGAAIFDLDPEDFTPECLGEDNLRELHPYLEQEDQRQFEQQKENLLLESIDSTCRSFFLSVAKSSFGKEAQTWEKENQSHKDSAHENNSSESSSFASLVSAVLDDEIIETSVDASNEKLSRIGDKHDDRAFKSWIQHEEQGDDSPLSIVQSHNGMSICETNVLNEEDENLSLISSDNFEVVHENIIGNNRKTTTATSADGYALPDYSTTDKQLYLDCSCQNSHDADRGIIDSEVQGSVISLPTRDKDSRGQGSRRPEIKAVDQVMYLDCERFSVPNTELFPDNTAVVPNDDKFQPSDHIFSAPAICSYEADANLSSVPDDSSEEHIEKGIQEERDIQCVFVGSALETSEHTLPSESVNASQTTVSEGQDARIFGGSYPKDKSTCGHLEAEKEQLIGMTMPGKMDLFSHVLARNAEKQSYDEDDIHDVHPMSLPNINDSDRPTCSEESGEQVLPLDKQNTEDSHSHHTQPETSQGISHCWLWSHGAELTKDPKVHSNDHSCAPRDFNEECIRTNSIVPGSNSAMLDKQNTEDSHSHHTQPETSQGISHCWLWSHEAELTKDPKVHSNDHSCAPQDFNEECIRTNSIVPGSNSAMLEVKNYISSKEISEVQYQVHLVDEVVGTITNHTAHDDTEERQKGTGELEKNAPTASATSAKSKQTNARRKMITSIAGSITMVGAMLVFLHMRGKKDKERSSQTVVPQPTKKTSSNVYTENKVEKTGKSDRVYPGERFKF